MRLRSLALLALLASHLWPAEGNESIGVQIRNLEVKVTQLKETIGHLGKPQDGKSSKERRDLEETASNLEDETKRLVSTLEQLESEDRKYDALLRDIESKRRMAKWDLEVASDKYANWQVRFNANQREVKEQLREYNKATTNLQGQAAADWGRRLNQQLAGLIQEGDDLDRLLKGAEGRLEQLDQQVRDLTTSQEARERSRWLLIEDTRMVSQRWEDLLSKVMALHKIVIPPPDGGLGWTPESRARKLFLDFSNEIGMEGSLKAIEFLLRRYELESLPLGTVITLADITTDIALEGVDERTHEVMNNVYLIGNYGAAMKEMIRTQGGKATQDDRYLAMRDELERLQKTMPSTQGEFLLQSFTNSAAFTAALGATLAHFVSKTPGHFGKEFMKHLNNAERHALKGLIVPLREGLNVFSKASVSWRVKQYSKSISEHVRKRAEPQKTEEDK